MLSLCAKPSWTDEVPYSCLVCSVKFGHRLRDELFDFETSRARSVKSSPRMRGIIEKCVQCCVLVLLVWCFPGRPVAAQESIRKAIILKSDVDEFIPVNEGTKYVYNFTYPAASGRYGPARLTIESYEARSEYPIIVVIWHEKGVMSWEIPYEVGNLTYTKVSRILCPEENYNKSASPFAEMRYQLPRWDEEDKVFVSLSTASKTTIMVRLQLRTSDVNNFLVKTNVLYSVPPSINLGFTPSEPWYYQFNWNKNATSVVLRVDSKKQKNTCMTLSIQPISCPVLDSERTVGHDGYWQTIDWKGGVTISKHDFPDGFYIVFILNGDDSKCNPSVSDNFQKRSKSISFIFTETIGLEKYYVAVLSPLIVYGSVCLVFFIGALLYARRPYPRFDSNISLESNINQLSRENLETEEMNRANIQNTEAASAENPPLNEAGVDTTDVSAASLRALRARKSLYVCDLAKQDSKLLRHKSDMYVFQLLTVAVFYSLPVAQLMLSYQTMLHKTGNQDACFYNFLCAHPISINEHVSISDFNHIFSNVGYVILGLLYISWTMRRDSLYKKAVAKCPALDQLYGIPQHYGFFYAIGWALIMEGFLSASYHICPNRSNFQFDTSFMYIMAVLCMVKLYHNRHPDINASAYTTFMTLALIIFFGMIGIIESSDGFFIFISVIHLLMCIWLSLQVYNLGRLSLDKSLLGRMKEIQQEVVDHPKEYLKPKYPSRMILLIIGNAMNAVLVYVGWNFGLKSDFGSYLLTVLLTNLMLYFGFYIIMKLINGEKLLFKPTLYCLASIGLAVPSCYFFFAKVTSWRDTPAVSRRGNMECLKPLDFYDYHDVWHFLSAGGLFCMFMVLLTLDDDLINVPRSKIPVF